MGLIQRIIWRLCPRLDPRGRYGRHTIRWCGQEYDGLVWERVPDPSDTPPPDWQPEPGQTWQQDWTLRRRR